jgi:signal transduction histidine kinase
MTRKGDLWLTGTCILAVLVECALRPELTPISAALGIGFASALWFRRTHPLAATAFAFSLAAAGTLVEVWLGLPEVGPYTGACILILPYALGRWGSGRDVTIGVVFMAAAYAASMLQRPTDAVADAVGGAVIFCFPLVIGVSLRFRAAAQARDLEHARHMEREQLARELHDSVAHHMTAITIQAQAARAVVVAQPAAAERALLAIEAESRNTLAELRAIVGALRDDEPGALTPAGRVADIAGFARDGGSPPAVTVELTGNLEDLPPAVERTLYRLAQESITNAIKHAKNATRVAIRVAAEGNNIRLTAQDDGAAPTRRPSGYGLIGMAERAALLGGTFEAGPSPGGWRVDAMLPRKGGHS